MKNKLIVVCLLGFALSCKEKAKQSQKEEVVVLEEVVETVQQDNDWEILFDGTSFDQWKEFKQDVVTDVWKIEDGAMVYTPPKKGGDGHHDLLTRKDFTNFILSLEWKISEGGNSGVFWGVNEGDTYSTPYQSGPEIQVLDNQRHPDAKAGTTHQSGSLYDMVPPKEDVTNPVGEWNTMVLTIDYNAQHGSVNLNGVEIVEFPLDNEAWDQMVEKSKFKGWEGFGKFHTGKIGLQDHGNVVSFRNIKIKEL